MIDQAKLNKAITKYADDIRYFRAKKTQVSEAFKTCRKGSVEEANATEMWNAANDLKEEAVSELLSIINAMID